MHKYPWLDLQAATTFQLTASQTVATLTALDTLWSGAVQAFITISAAPVRYAFGGYTPTATSGHWIDQKESIVLQGWDEMKYFRYIRSGGTNAVLWCTYKYPKGDHPRG